MKIFFDTETTGLWLNNKPMGHPDQPRIVQIAAILTDDEGLEIQSINLSVYQESVPDKAASIHGKTTEFVHAYGINEGTAVQAFEELLAIADEVIAHNGEYDQKVVLNAIRLLDGVNAKDPFEEKKAFCTMRATTPICRIPSSRGYKWPKLTEAYEHLFGESFDGAHDALADVRACKDVYFAVQKIMATNRAAREGKLEVPV